MSYACDCYGFGEGCSQFNFTIAITFVYKYNTQWFIELHFIIEQNVFMNVGVCV